MAAFTRQQAWELLCEHTKSEHLRKHGLAVEAAMRHFARKYGEDEETWGIVGLVHDFDYERDPAGHPQNGKAILEQAGMPAPMVHAVQTHGDHLGLPRVTPMEKALYALDELTGFIIAVALVRPTKRVADVEPAAVRKKMKDKAFARAVSREMLLAGAAALPMEYDDLVREVVTALTASADVLGLEGAPA
ncbi:MAG TPA: HAD family hydrolase [Candidatus Limnocylindria bacterium]|nr:HAD family hydrolase [Candidatus Limnocylindria bacterium]